MVTGPKATMAVPVLFQATRKRWPSNQVVVDLVVDEEDAILPGKPGGLGFVPDELHVNRLAGLVNDPALVHGLRLTFPADKGQQGGGGEHREKQAGASS